MPEYLTTTEFVRWADQFDKKLDEIAEIRKDTVENTVQIAILQTQQAKAKGISGVIATIVSGVIAGIISFGGSR